MYAWKQQLESSKARPMRLAVPTPTNEYGWGQLVGHDRSFPVLVDRGHGNTYEYDGFKNGYASYVFRMPSGKVCRVQRSGSEWITNGMDGSVYVRSLFSSCTAVRFCVNVMIFLCTFSCEAREVDRVAWSTLFVNLGLIANSLSFTPRGDRSYMTILILTDSNILPSHVHSSTQLPNRTHARG